MAVLVIPKQNCIFIMGLSEKVHQIYLLLTQEVQKKVQVSVLVQENEARTVQSGGRKSFLGEKMGD